MGIKGLALASVIRELCGYVLLLIYTNNQEDISEAVFMPDSESFDNLGEQIKLAVPAAIMVMLEWWIWELMILISGYLGVAEQASTVIVM
jgi:Na+-driven multidrug efflux pump